MEGGPKDVQDQEGEEAQEVEGEVEGGMMMTLCQNWKMRQLKIAPKIDKDCVCLHCTYADFFFEYCK